MPTKLSSQIDVTIAKKLEIMKTAANLGFKGLNLFSTGNKNILLDTNLIVKLQEEIHKLIEYMVPEYFVRRLINMQISC